MDFITLIEKIVEEFKNKYLGLSAGEDGAEISFKVNKEIISIIYGKEFYDKTIEEIIEDIKEKLK